MNMVMTKVTTPIIGWVASILGWVINAIYALLEMIGFPNIGLAIILFTFVVYMAMMPLQIKQQKFSKLNSIMQPEIQKIQAKYKNKKDQESLQKQNEEINFVYQKYGVSPTGSCVQLLIQMPVLLSLYQVIYKIPGYISGVREIFVGLAENITKVNGFGDIIKTFMTDNQVSIYGVNPGNEFAIENVIDFLYGLQPAQMEAFSKLPEFSSFTTSFAEVTAKADDIRKFFVLNISDTPMSIMKSGWAMGNGMGYLMAFMAVMIPVLAWFTQWLNYKLMPQSSASKNNEQPGTMETTMKSMNTVMPVMSAVFCFSFPVGIGIYWVIGAVIRCMQQVVLNKKMDHMDVDEYIRKNQEKMRQNMIKRGIDPDKINQQARMNVRNIQQPVEKKAELTAEQKADKVKKSTEYYKNTEYKPGSLAAKANMVKQFDEKGKKK